MAAPTVYTRFDVRAVPGRAAMERLGLRDLRTLLEFLRELYEIRDLPAFRAHTMTALLKVIPAHMVGYSEMELDNSRSENWTWPEAHDPRLDLLWEQHMHQHPILVRYATTGSGQSCKISDFLTRRQYHQLGLYSEVYRPMRTEDELGILIPVPARGVVGVGLHRDGRDFSERDRLVLGLIRPHLAQAYLNASAVTLLLQEKIEAIASGPERVPRALMIVAGDGRIRLASERCRRWLVEYFGAGDASQMLPDLLRRWLSHEEARTTALDDAPPTPSPLRVEREGKHLVVHLLHHGEQYALLFEEHGVSPTARNLRRLGLTRREAEVLAWVAEGKTNAEIAIILGGRPRTVAKHLERIYQKLGVENRTAAAACAFEVLGSREGVSGTSLGLE